MPRGNSPLIWPVLIIILISTVPSAHFFSSDFLLCEAEGMVLMGTIYRNGTWNVTGTETYRNDDIMLRGNLSVTGTLVLENVNLSVNSSSGEPNWINISNGGTLRAKNCTIFPEFGSYGYLISAGAGSNVYLDNVTVVSCGDPLSSNNSRKGFYSRSDNLTAINSTFMGSFYGMVLEGGDTQLTDITFLEIIDRAALMTDSSKTKFDGVFMINVLGVGLDCRDSDCEVYDGSLISMAEPVIANGSKIFLSGCSIGGSSYLGIFTSSNITMVDCYQGVGSADGLVVEEPWSKTTSIFMLNTSLPVSSISDPSAEVVSALRIDFRVTTNGGQPAPGAQLTLIDSNDSEVLKENVDENGELKDIEVVDRVETSTGIQEKDPHTMEVRYDGAERSREITINEGYLFEISVVVTSPVVEISHPEDGAYLNSNNFILTATIIDSVGLSAVSIRIDGGNEIALSPENELSLDLSLNDGFHDIELFATNLDGRTTNQGTEFWIDTMAPVITVLTPRDGTYWNGSYIEIRGTCSPDASLKVGNDVVAMLDGDFNTTHYLKDGWNTILLSAVDRAGNSASLSLMVFRDSTPPIIDVQYPHEGFLTSDLPVNVQGIVDQSVIELTVNYRPVNIVNGSFQTTVTDLSEGGNTIVIIGTDRTGSRTVVHRNVILDTIAPGVSLIEAPSLTGSDTVTIRGTTEAGASVTINGVPVLVVDGVFTHTVSLNEGNNQLTIYSVDLVGNVGTLSYEVFMDVQPPEFTEIDPPHMSRFTNPVVRMELEVYDEKGVATVEGKSGDGQYVRIMGSGNYEWIVTLDPGENIIDLQATDNVGNVRFTQLIYYLDSLVVIDDIPPVVNITNPGNRTILEEVLEIEVRGTASDETELAKVEIRVGGGNWSNVTGSTSWNATLKLGFGPNLIEVRAFDESGNIGYDSVVVNVIHGSNDEDGKEDKVDWVKYVLIGIVVLLVFVFLALLYGNIQLRKEEEALELRKEEESMPPHERRSRRGGERARVGPVRGPRRPPGEGI